MATVSIENAVGIDKVVNEIQAKVYKNLTKNACADGWNDKSFMFYHIARKNPKAKDDTTKLPEVYKIDLNNIHKDYQNALYNDNFAATAYFTVANSSTLLSSKLYSQDISLYFQLDLKQVYPTLTYRADFVAENDALKAVEGCPDVLSINNVTRTVEDVYSEFDTSQITLDDMHPKHVFRVDMSIRYDASCYYHCEFPETGNNNAFNYVLNFGLAG